MVLCNFRFFSHETFSCTIPLIFVCFTIGMPGIQKQLSYLHDEENKMLNKLASANVILEGLKQKMASVQETIRTYTDKICKISEKKNKLLSKMSTTASKDMIELNHIPHSTVNTSAVSSTSQYITPPRSPVRPSVDPFNDALSPRNPCMVERISYNLHQTSTQNTRTSDKGERK